MRQGDFARGTNLFPLLRNAAGRAPREPTDMRMNTRRTRTDRGLRRSPSAPTRDADPTKGLGPIANPHAFTLASALPKRSNDGR